MVFGVSMVNAPLLCDAVIVAQIKHFVGAWIRFESARIDHMQPHKTYAGKGEFEPIGAKSNLDYGHDDRYNKRNNAVKEGCFLKLKPDVNITAFMKAVQMCCQDVLFISQEGDRLNLKSALSQFLFVMLQTKPEILGEGKIICDKADAELLHPYVQE